MICSCGTELDMTDPAFEVVNQVTVSMIVINHGMMQGKTCGNCGQGYFCAIQGFDLSTIKLALVPIPEKEEKKLIEEAPVGFDPKKRFM